ncbi:MAG: hypothetical protein QFB87_03300 [Patescibacteria group bacterium]|nr:hypothetical protein [Patescibacteria group bacterium]
MTATNHALTGALIGLAVGNPYIAVPAALASHFVCDALPHFGAGNKQTSQSWFRNLLILEFLLCVTLVFVLAVTQPAHWLLAASCAFVATSPDFMWIKQFLRAQRGRIPTADSSMLLRFHAGIQWFERPIGAVFEVAWALSALILLKLYIF